MSARHGNAYVSTDSIGLSAYADPHYVEAIMDAGAVGYFTKGDAGDLLLYAMINSTRERPSFGAGISIPAAAKATAATAHPGCWSSA